MEAMLDVGLDRILFSVDYPFEDMSRVAISEADRLKIACKNAP